MARASTRRTAIERETFLTLVKAVGDLEREVAALLKPRDLSVAQYNVLRILRGAGPVGAACGEIGAKLIKHDPDITRLGDKLERAGLTERRRDETDRRIVRTRITEAGLNLLDELDGPVDELHHRQLGHLSEASLATIRELLGSARLQP